MPKNAQRLTILSDFRKIGLMSDVKRFTSSSGSRRYAPANGLAVGIYVAKASSSYPVRDIGSVPVDPQLASEFAKYVNPSLDPGETPWVGCLLVDPRWDARIHLQDRKLVQFQAFDHGLIAVPRTGDHLLEDPGDHSVLLAIAMSLVPQQQKVESTLYWRRTNGKIGIDTWKWPD